MALLMKPAPKCRAEKDEDKIAVKSKRDSASAPNDKDREDAKEGVAFFSAVLGSVMFLFRVIGSFFMVYMKGIGKRWRSFYQKHLRQHTHKLDMLCLGVRKRLSRLYKGSLFRVYLFLRFLTDAWYVVRGGFRSHSEKNVFLRCCYAVRAFFQGVRNNAHIFVTALNYSLPVVAVAVFVHLISYVFALNFAVGVEYNGEHVGYVEDEKVYEQAATQLQERLLYQENDDIIDNIPKFEIAVVEPSELKTEAQLTDTIIRSSSQDMVEATGVKVDGKLLGVVKDATPIRNELNGLLDNYRTGAQGERVEFTKDIEMVSGLYLQKHLKSSTSVLSTLTSLEDHDVYYTVVEGDAPSLIAQEHDMTTNELVALNPDILENCLVGKQVLINKSQPYLPVKSIRKETYVEEIPYETTTIEDPKIYVGTSKTVTKGVEGEMGVTAEVSYVDGVEIERKVLSSVVLAEPVERVVAKGTLPMPIATGFENSKRSDLGFINPINSGRAYISQPFGRTRFNSNHTGIDIAFRGNGYGTPIVAVYPGTVEYAGWKGSYGNLVIVNHGGGIKTYYAHCSKLTVSRGQQVSLGQQVGNVGSTGRSSGNHCHFMVVVNGVYKNPLNYINGY